VAERGGNPGDEQTRPLAEGRDAPRVQPGDPAEAPTRPAAETPDAPTQPHPAHPAPAPSAAPVPYGQQQHYPAQYQYPAPGAPVVVQQKTNGMAIASMVLGILWLYWIGSILALIFGMVAKSQIDRSGGYEAGRGMAIAGIVLGWVGIGFLLIFILFFGLAGCGAVLAGSG
jgi:uncharacterized membrane protein